MIVNVIREIGMYYNDCISMFVAQYQCFSVCFFTFVADNVCISVFVSHNGQSLNVCSLMFVAQFESILYDASIQWGYFRMRFQARRNLSLIFSKVTLLNADSRMALAK